MHPEVPGLITAGRHHATPAATPDNQWPALQFWLFFALYSHKKGIQIQMYNVPVHTANY
jgi:hypothetical protein